MSAVAGALGRRAPAVRHRMRALSRPLAAVRRHQAIAAMLLYVAIAAVYERHAIAHLDSVCACGFGGDPSQYMWAMVWWPHAILHGLNPLVTHAIWADPAGYDLAAATATPAAALAAAPITALAGPLVSFNIVATLAPAVSAWFAYRLCFYITRRPAASLLGGYLFGFSSYELGQMLGHLHLTLTFAIPAAALLALKRIDGAIGPRRFVVLTALLLAIQLLISSEVLLTMTCTGIAALVCGWIFAAPPQRERIIRLVPEIVAALALIALVCSPYIYEALRGPRVAKGIDFSADALNFFIPTAVTRIGGHRFQSVSVLFAGNPSEQGAYLGLPLIAIVAAFSIQTWRTRVTKILVSALAVAVLWSLGDHLHIDGYKTMPMPWSLLWHLPLLDQLQTVRIAVYVSLICAVMASMWLAAPARHAALRWSLAALAVVFLIPSTGAPYPGIQLSMFHTTESEPALFTTGLYRRYLRRGDVVLPLPYGGAPWGYSLLWQARTHMYFKLASGIWILPASYATPIVRELFDVAPLTPTAPQDLRAFIAEHGVTAIVADPLHSGPWLGVLAKLGLRPASAGGALVYRIPSDWGA